MVKLHPCRLCSLLIVTFTAELFVHTSGIVLLLTSRHLYKMVDSCRQLTVSQSNGDEDTAGMVTILTGHEVEELCTRSAAMKVSDG